MKRRFWIVLNVTLATLLISGCAGLPPYAPDPGTQTSPVELSPDMASDTLGMCTEHRQYSLVPKNGVVYVPDGARIRIWRGFAAGGYRVMYSCAPGISFVPEHGVSYYADFELRAQRCSLLVYRKDPLSRTGIALEPTIGNDLCSADAH